MREAGGMTRRVPLCGVPTARVYKGENVDAAASPRHSQSRRFKEWQSVVVF